MTMSHRSLEQIAQTKSWQNVWPWHSDHWPHLQPQKVAHSVKRRAKQIEGSGKNKLALSVISSQFDPSLPLHPLQLHTGPKELFLLSQQKFQTNSTPRKGHHCNRTKVIGPIKNQNRQKLKFQLQALQASTSFSDFDRRLAM